MAAKRTHVLKVRVDPEEHRELEWAAKRAGVTLSAWIRSLVLEAARARKGG